MLRLLCSPRAAFAALVLVTVAPACSGDDPPPSPASPSLSDPPSTKPVCTAPAGTGTEHQGGLVGDETWTAANSPHVITAPLSIGIGRTLTIEGCAVVRLKGNTGIVVEGKLVATGVADKPIYFGRADADVAWSSLEARKGSELRIAYTLFEGGGNPNGSRLTQTAMLDIRGDQEAASQGILFVDNVVLKGSASLGINLREGGGFAPGSMVLGVTESASFPVSIWGRAAGTLPTGTYTGNATDEIFLPAMGGRDDIVEDTTLGNAGVPYRVGGDTGGTLLNVGTAKGAAPLLTIEAGVTLRFAKGARLAVAGGSGETARGALRAVGTSQAPVVFTSAEPTPAAGDWVGIIIQGPPDARDAITSARVAYAGAASQISSYGCPSALAKDFGNDGSIVVYGGAPASSFVTNTTIENGAGDGIVRGWTGEPVDFVAGNTFTNVERCWQTFPKPASGICEDPAPCPR